MQYIFALLFSLHIPFSSPLPTKEIPASILPARDSVIQAALLKPEEIARLQFDDSLSQLYQTIGLKNFDLGFDVFRYGMIGYNTAQLQGKLNPQNLITIIDFTKPSTQKRFYIIDLETKKVLYHTYVSHGKNSGENEVSSFSNVVHSNQSSLGFYLTAETYVGSKGYSLKLDGLERGYNDNMRERAVVMHQADYVSEYWIKKYGRLGRSQGCPALPVDLSKEIIDVIKNHTLIFAYYNDPIYLENSAYLNINNLIASRYATASIKSVSQD